MEYHNSHYDQRSKSDQSAVIRRRYHRSNMVPIIMPGDHILAEKSSLEDVFGGGYIYYIEFEGDRSGSPGIFRLYFGKEPGQWILRSEDEASFDDAERFSYQIKDIYKVKALAREL